MTSLSQHTCTGALVEEWVVSKSHPAIHYRAFRACCLRIVRYQSIRLTREVGAERKVLQALIESLGDVQLGEVRRCK